MTRNVKTPGAVAAVENGEVVNYNAQVSNTRVSAQLVLAILIAPMLLGAACEKKKPNDTGAVSAMDRVGSGSTAQPSVGPADTTPMKGIDVTKLDGDKQKLFYALVASLKSPCGKSHSLRTSYEQDTACKRAPYAVKYVAALIEDEVKESDVREFFANKYEKTPQIVKIDPSKAPRIGKPDAPVRLVEFFDYECPHCAAFSPTLTKVEDKEAGKVVVYYMMFPIEAKHPESRSAAMAALAANQQGKFKDMHDLLFARSPQHNKEAVTGFAKELGLDPARFAADYAAADARVSADLSAGESAGVDSTPTLFFNDRKYEGPMNPEYISMWIEEEIAVNR
jgi:protein-disulfide isomerase